MVGANTKKSSTFRDYQEHREATGNWRRGRDPSNSPFYRRTDRLEPIQQKETVSKPYQNNTRMEVRSTDRLTTSSHEMLPPRQDHTQDLPNSHLQLVPPNSNTHPREPNLPGPSNSFETRNHTNSQKELQGRRDSEVNTQTQNYTNTGIKVPKSWNQRREKRFTLQHSWFRAPYRPRNNSTMKPTGQWDASCDWYF